MNKWYHLRNEKCWCGKTHKHANPDEPYNLMIFNKNHPPIWWMEFLSKIGLAKKFVGIEIDCQIEGYWIAGTFYITETNYMFPYQAAQIAAHQVKIRGLK